ncbi:MAG: hypothetical protein ACLQGP_39855 [Isosphaeraceae bacterium]
MKSSFAALTLFGALAAVPAWAQTPYPGPAPASSQPAAAIPKAPSPSGGGPASMAPGEKKVFSATGALPGPASEEELKAGPTVVLPDDPLEPYLLSKENGPFMVMAKVFRGPDAEKMALALCKELRHDYGLPAYILRTKDFPMRSYIRGTPPTAPSVTKKAVTRLPEAVRTHDEAAVLVGNEKTLAATEILLNKVKKLHPKCLGQMKSLYPWREGGSLSRALRTTNPYIPAQLLYPKAPDKLVIQMNSGLRSIANCPGRFSLQIAQFSGRSTFDLNDPKGGPTQPLFNLRNSPLQTAHDDAERMADKLSKAPEIRRLGQPVFVYHDRTSSRVFIGAFNSPTDPAIVAMRNELLKAAVPLSDKSQRGWNATDVMIVPATNLTDVDVIKTGLQ